jgi:hypothetical protein
MAIEPNDPHPEQGRLQAIIACCEKRVRRADEKARVALIEQAEALVALDAAQLRLARWREENPDPQGSLLEGLNHV